MIVLANPNLGSFPKIPIRARIKRDTHCRSSVFLSNSRRVLAIANREGKRRCECFDMHKELVSYAEAWSLQHSIVKERKELVQQNEDCSDTLIILQHHPVYTLGTASSEEHLNFELKDAPFNVYRTERGGEVTYHGPGQLVMYPIINLRYHKMDLHWYLRALEEVVIRVLSSTFSVKSSRVEGLTGVWVDDRKLAAIGIRASQWITYHGLSLNVTTDLTPFQWIVPCGIHDRRVGSIKGLLREILPSDECGGIADINHADDNQLIDITYLSLVKEYCEVFQVELHQKTVPILELSKRESSISGTGN